MILRRDFDNITKCVKSETNEIGKEKTENMNPSFLFVFEMRLMN
jgi:hypothetical protein